MMHRLELSGTPWRMRGSDFERGRPKFAERDEADSLRYLPATVPGEVHLDLMKLGLIADVYQKGQILAARWVEEKIWSYRKEFVAPAEARAEGVRAWLHFAGLDYAAEIVLNGKKAGTHANFFRPCRVEVTGLLRDTNNILAVHLDSGLYHVADKPAAGYEWNNSWTLTKRHWLRKPQCQFVWDWSNRLVNVGIHGRVWLEYTADPLRVEQLIPLATVSEDLRSGHLRTRVAVENLTAAEVPAILEVEIPAAGLKVRQAVSVKPGASIVEAGLEVPSPRLWWPLGHGEQNRYTVRATLEYAGQRYELPVKQVGFRHVRINQDPHPVSGSYFVVEVNHTPIFCKGANFVPADMIFAAIDDARYDRLVALALEQNFNFLRVWGGGLYESDHFFDLCDAHGILVWQEFIYACGKYPHTDEAFHREAEREAVHQIRRLAHHPSLVIWCGNNENETAHWNWGSFDRGVIGSDYMFYHLTLPRLMAQEDPTRYYHPSSPLSPNNKNPNDDDAGDQHPWAVGFADTNFRKYRKMVCRFPNEGGLLGPTSLPTMHACLPEGQKYIQSFAWQVHDNTVDSWEEPSPVDRMTEFHLGLDCRKMSLEEYAYWGGLIQGEGLREYADNFRRRMFDSAAAIFWMYNDCWPATRSWTTVDYYLRRTPSFHPVRRGFEPVHVVLAEEEDAVDVYGINDTASPVRGRLVYGVMALAGGYPFKQEADVELPANRSVKIASFSRAKWGDAAREIAFASLSQGTALITRNRLILPLFKEVKWPRAAVTVRLEQGYAVFESSAFAWGVCLDLDGSDAANPADNFFDVWPGMPYRIAWPGSIPPRILHIGNL